jgi:dTDP-4-dehydrorhamnose reductase
MRILVTGASGQLGAYLLRELQGQALAVTAWSGSAAGELFGYALHPVDLVDLDAVKRAFAVAAPDAVIHTAALAKVADCHRDPAAAQRINTEATAHLAGLCRGAGVRLVHVSTDLVFDGTKGNYCEVDEASPLSVYGRSKLHAEQALLAMPRVAVARVSLLYGPSLIGRKSFFDDQVSALRTAKPLKLFVDEWRTPLDLGTAAKGLIELAFSENTGVFHMGGPLRMSRYEMGCITAAFLGVEASASVAANQADVPAPEPRPRDVSLDSSKWRRAFPQVPWPSFVDALQAMPLSSEPRP